LTNEELDEFKSIVNPNPEEEEETDDSKSLERSEA
jgi:hypothetical protein